MPEARAISPRRRFSAPPARSVSGIRWLRVHLGMTVLLLAARQSLKRGGVTDTLRRLTHGRAVAPGLSATEALRAVRRPGRVFGVPCLAQAVALSAALSRAGQQPTLVLGCRRYDDRRWGAHAWVVVDDQVFDPLPSGPHEPLARLENATGWVPAPLEAS